MRSSTTAFLLMLCGSLAAQDLPERQKLRSPFDPQGTHQTFAIKAKGIYYPQGDWSGWVGGAGLEHSFFKRHSLGADVIYHYIGGTYDAFTDTNGVEHPDGGTHRFVEQAVILSYRYYLESPWLRERYWVPYLSAFARYGTIEEENDPEYTRFDIARHDIHRSVGLLFGMLLIEAGSGHFAADINLGPFYKWKDENSFDLVDGQLVEESSQTTNVGLRVDINFCVFLFWPKR